MLSLKSSLSVMQVIKILMFSILILSLFLPWTGIYDLQKMEVVKVQSLNVIDSLSFIKNTGRLAEYYPLALLSVIAYLSSIVFMVLSLFWGDFSFAGGLLAIISANLWAQSLMIIRVMVFPHPAPGSPPMPSFSYAPYQPDVAVYMIAISGVVLVMMKIIGRLIHIFK
ncbi:MAG: hypothetical protein NDF55_01905 [archaeon GB-1867-005]|nr:hypothetical protein [Candidatus Culexmicrobium cathedralense]